MIGGASGMSSSSIILILILILQVVLYVYAFTTYHKIKDRRGPPGRGTCPYN